MYILNIEITYLKYIQKDIEGEKNVLKIFLKVKTPWIYEPRMHPVHGAMNSTKQSK